MRKTTHRAIHRTISAFVPADGATPYRPAREACGPEEFFAIGEPPQLAIEQVRRLGLAGPTMLRKRFAFNSPVRSGIAANDTVRGYWFTPTRRIVRGSLVFLHDWKTASLGRLQRMARHAVRLGAEVFLPAQPFHAWRRPALTYPGLPLLTPDLDRSLRAMRQAVLDVRSLLAWVQRRSQGPLVLAGVGLGGLVAGLTATLHPGLDGLVLVASPDSVSELLWCGSADRGRFRDAMARAGVERAAVDRAWAVLDPSWRPPLLPRERILLIKGRYDDERSCLDRLSQRWGGARVSSHEFADSDFPFFARPVVAEALALVGIAGS
jgi:pimeloyl-ACP methyl ester carboxylesterase